MPAVAVIGQAVRMNHTRNGAAAMSPAVEHTANGRNRRDTLRGGGVTPAWNIPENGLKKQNGRTAKTERGTLRKQFSAYRKWMSRDKVGHGSTTVGQRKKLVVDDVPQFRPSQKYKETPSAAVILYMGIGMVFVGMVITFVGVGEKGFTTLELKLIGPCLIILGVITCGARVVVCCCANKCSYCDEEIEREDPVHSAGNGRIKSNQIDSLRLSTKPMFGGVTPIPFAVSPGPMLSAPQLPSTSTRVSLEPEMRRNSWDEASSMDFDYNTMPTNVSAQPKPPMDNSSSVTSADISDDNEFCEIELKKVSTSVKPVKETSTNNLATNTPTDPTNTIEIPKNNDKSIDDGLSISVNADKSNCLSAGVMLDPQQYLRRATLAASCKTIR